jgi:hypothetical protein
MDSSRAFAAAIALVILASSSSFAQTQQDHVHGMAHSVMPFDVAKTIHIFKMTDTGGSLRVIVRDPNNADQITLIQHHLNHEASRFRHGDYSDPATLHGATMPGITELHDGAERIRVYYSELPDGAEISFYTTDLHLLTAIHRWFGAQLSEHGADAKAE